MKTNFNNSKVVKDARQISVLNMGMSSVGLEYQSPMTHMYWLFWFVFGNSHSIPIKLKARGKGLRNFAVVAGGAIDLRFGAFLTSGNLVVGAAGYEG